MYTDNTKWFETSELKKSISDILDNKSKLNILEIGSYEGMSACYFSDNLLNNEQSRLTCVDPFDTSDATNPVKQNTKEIFLSNIEKSKNFHKIVFKNQYSDDFFRENKEMFDFIYIDGSHEPEQVKKDMINAFQVIKEGCIIWMDDYLGDYPRFSMKTVIDQFIFDNKDKLDVIHSGYQLAFRKKGGSEINNYIEIVPHYYPDKFLIKIYPIDEKNCEIIAVRLDQNHFWGLDLQFKIYNQDKTDFEIVKVGSSTTFYKTLKYQLSKISFFGNKIGNFVYFI